MLERTIPVLCFYWKAKYRRVSQCKILNITKKKYLQLVLAQSLRLESLNLGFDNFSVDPGNISHNNKNTAPSYQIM